MAGATTAGGWGWQHQKERRRWAVLVAQGVVRCARPGCGRLIEPGEPWDLGHDDWDRSRRWGPEHRSCNRRAGGLKRQGLLPGQRRAW